jgi:serine O-acetyltransferase
VRLRNLILTIRYDLNRKGEIKLKHFVSSFFFNPSFRLLLNYRIGRYLMQSNWKINRLIAYRFLYKQLTKRNCYISFNALIGKGLRFTHPLGIVIGDKVVIEDNVTIWQQVTLGRHGKSGEDYTYPTIKNNVKIFAGAKVFGGITIGENAIIGANAVVFRDVPDNCLAVGIPARIIYPE